MIVAHITFQVFQAITLGIFLTLNTIIPITLSKPDDNYRLEKIFENIRSSIDSKAAENGHFKSFLSPDQGRKPSIQFSELQEDVDEQMSGLDFNFDQSAYDKFHLPQKQSVKPKFVLNYEPLRPSNYISAPSSHYSDYPFIIPEHQDDGGDSGGGDGDDGGDDMGGGGGGGGGGGSNGGGGGGGGNGGGDGGGNGGLGDGNDGRFTEHQSFEQDYDNFEPHNVPGYGTNQLPATSNSYQKPFTHRSAYKKKQPYRFADDDYTQRLVENKRPLRVFDNDDDDVQPLKLRGNSRRPLRLNEEKRRLYNQDDFLLKSDKCVRN
ncbi:heavy metal-associated isoprenylated plant protein 33-like [Melanaphis sacchari]|uniref:heavy metal-associated isoprenylated plant protein 33-like n=1 Tax=Melanaphis sacchari TaxID=742174 RepID=UPI000DC1587F|nr:heavy metal-associated isoprenylated plant protein 33-like [Melanaphis sacchari]